MVYPAYLELRVEKESLDCQEYLVQEETLAYRDDLEYQGEMEIRDIREIWAHQVRLELKEMMDYLEDQALPVLQDPLEPQEGMVSLDFLD